MKNVQMKPSDDLQDELESLRQQLNDAHETLEAIRNGEVDALIVNGKDGHELFTLKTADHTYRVFIETLTEGALSLDVSGVVLYCNSSFAGMISRTSESVVSEHFETFVSDPDKEKFRALLKTAWTEDAKGELLLVHPEGTVPVQLSITKLAMQDGKTLSMLVTNLTAQKETLRQQKIKTDQLAEMNLLLELSNHDLQQFASVASHDLQEPLRKIQIFSHLLEDKFSHELSEIPKQYLDKIVSSARRMKTLIVDILNYSRLSANDNTYVKTDLKRVFNELLEDLELTIHEKNATVIVRDLPEAEINVGQMRQVFQNLLSNALKFSRKDVPPVIEVWYRKDLTEFPSENKLALPYYHIHVRDNGIGFDEKYSKNIFNLFEKLHSKDDYEGTGIGLAITRKIIDKHNGYINVKSQEGSGTEFIISIPVHQ